MFGNRYFGNVESFWYVFCEVYSGNDSVEIVLVYVFKCYLDVFVGYCIGSCFVIVFKIFVNGIVGDYYRIEGIVVGSIVFFFVFVSYSEEIGFGK